MMQVIAQDVIITLGTSGSLSLRRRGKKGGGGDYKVKRTLLIDY